MSRDQCDVTHARQPVAHLPESLPRSARVGKNQHARPRAIHIRDVQRPVAVAIGRGDLDVQPAHSAASTGLVEADRPESITRWHPPRCQKAATVPVNCEDTCITANWPWRANSRMQDMAVPGVSPHMMPGQACHGAWLSADAGGPGGP